MNQTSKKPSSKLDELKEFLHYRITRSYKDIPYSERQHYRMQLFPPIVWDLVGMFIWGVILFGIGKYLFNFVF